MVNWENLGKGAEAVGQGLYKLGQAASSPAAKSILNAYDWMDTNIPSIPIVGQGYSALANIGGNKEVRNKELAEAQKAKELLKQSRLPGARIPGLDDPLRQQGAVFNANIGNVAGFVPGLAGMLTKFGGDLAKNKTAQNVGQSLINTGDNIRKNTSNFFSEANIPSDDEMNLLSKYVSPKTRKVMELQKQLEKIPLTDLKEQKRVTDLIKKAISETNYSEDLKNAYYKAREQEIIKNSGYNALNNEQTPEESSKTLNQAMGAKEFGELASELIIDPTNIGAPVGMLKKGISGLTKKGAVKGAIKETENLASQLPNQDIISSANRQFPNEANLRAGVVDQDMINNLPKGIMNQEAPTMPELYTRYGQDSINFGKKLNTSEGTVKGIQPLNTKPKDVKSPNIQQGNSLTVNPSLYEQPSPLINSGDALRFADDMPVQQNMFNPTIETGNFNTRLTPKIDPIPSRQMQMGDYGPNNYNKMPMTDGSELIIDPKMYEQLTPGLISLGAKTGKTGTQQFEPLGKVSTNKKTKPPKIEDGQSLVSPSEIISPKISPNPSPNLPPNQVSPNLSPNLSPNQTSNFTPDPIPTNILELKQKSGLLGDPTSRALPDGRMVDLDPFEGQLFDIGKNLVSKDKQAQAMGGAALDAFATKLGFRGKGAKGYASNTFTNLLAEKARHLYNSVNKRGVIRPGLIDEIEQIADEYNKSSLRSGRNVGAGQSLGDFKTGDDYTEMVNNDFKGQAPPVDMSLKSNQPNNIEWLNRTTASNKTTETPEFKNWFGNSKVVDESGKPLVVYHGTPDNFTEFRENSWFTTDPNDSKIYSEMIIPDRPYNPKTIPSYISIKKPKYIQQYITKSEAEAFLAKSKKYDGLIIEKANGQKHYVVKSPTQIKSATGNSGKFNPNDPDIRHRIAPAEVYNENSNKVWKPPVEKKYDFQEVANILGDLKQVAPETERILANNVNLNLPKNKIDNAESLGRTANFSNSSAIVSLPTKEGAVAGHEGLHQMYGNLKNDDTLSLTRDASKLALYKDGFENFVKVLNERGYKDPKDYIDEILAHSMEVLYGNNKGLSPIRKQEFNEIKSILDNNPSMKNDIDSLIKETFRRAEEQEAKLFKSKNRSQEDKDIEKTLKYLMEKYQPEI